MHRFGFWMHLLLIFRNKGNYSDNNVIPSLSAYEKKYPSVLWTCSMLGWIGEKKVQCQIGTNPECDFLAEMRGVDLIHGWIKAGRSVFELLWQHSFLASQTPTHRTDQNSIIMHKQPVDSPEEDRKWPNSDTNILVQEELRPPLSRVFSMKQINSLYESFRFRICYDSNL